MANRQLPLVIETIQGTLIKEIPYVPALLLRKSAFNTEQEVVIMGRHMLTQLQTLEAATLEVADE